MGILFPNSRLTTSKLCSRTAFGTLTTVKLWVQFLGFRVVLKSEAFGGPNASDEEAIRVISIEGLWLQKPP